MNDRTVEKAKVTEFAEFDKMGEDRVRRLVTELTGLRRTWANEWLAIADQQSRLRNEASQSESLEIAKSAKDAAWEAARAAKTANTIAKGALLAALIAIAVAIYGVFATPPLA